MEFRSDEFSELFPIGRQLRALEQYVYELEDRVARGEQFEKKYNALLNDSLRHSQVMSTNMLKMALDMPVQRTLKEKP